LLISGHIGGALHLQKYFDVTLYFQLFKVGTEEASEKAKGDVQPFLKILDTHIANREYMVGETFTLADLNVASTINVALGAGYDLSSYPYIVTWMEKIKSRPAFLKLN
jgi:glutathione S-transferase